MFEKILSGVNLETYSEARQRLEPFAQTPEGIADLIFIRDHSPRPPTSLTAAILLREMQNQKSSALYEAIRNGTIHEVPCPVVGTRLELAEIQT